MDLRSTLIGLAGLGYWLIPSTALIPVGVGGKIIITYTGFYSCVYMILLYGLADLF